MNSTTRSFCSLELNKEKVTITEIQQEPSALEFVWKWDFSLGIQSPETPCVCFLWVVPMLVAKDDLDEG